MERIRWFEEARFGMFIHWGLYSILGRGEWVMHVEQIPTEEYALLARKFNPRKFDANKWVSLAKEAGMKYMVLTTRHHDGFCLFDSKVSDFTSVKTAAKRDFVAEYVKACRKAKMKIGFYYSLLDWRYPACFKGPKKNPEKWGKFVEYVHAQVRELCTNYGKIDILWYDGGWIPGNKPGSKNNFPPEKAWQSKKLDRMVRKLQPQILINDRSGLPEDFDTPEQYVPTLAGAPKRPWESCMTIGWTGGWGYTKHEPNLKGTAQLIENLVRCAGGSGNYLLNVGPKPDGTIPAYSVKRLKEIGKWMKVNSESVYGCGKATFGRGMDGLTPFEGGMVGLTTAKGNTVYLHVLRWPGKEICIARVKKKVKSAYFLANKKKVSVVQKGERLFLRNLPDKPLDSYDTVICLRASSLR